ncbi:hypothetical protein KUTeg_019811 [Tegillarca granosa]|uniref:Alanine--glyoxylate aminotransferase 2, mitochondrial n=1 Tax=Tegillarca granosa TaxID=220873 RepID=A0ABQ9EIS0_TEGGR|nr:hypothetical protein KUTeg_019811 [Tegillarca granosa]
MYTSNMAFVPSSILSRRITPKQLNNVIFNKLQPVCYRSTAALPKEMPPCDFKPEPYKGISKTNALKIKQLNLNPAIMNYYKNPVMIHQGYMQYLYDTDGERYLDLFGGIVTVSVGHCHPKVLARATDQMQKLWHTTNIYLHPTIHEYAEKLTSKLPGNLKIVYFTNSGSEANDLALFMARMYTGTYDTMNPDPYRGPWGGANCRNSVSQTYRSCDCAPGECNAGKLYLDQLEDVLRFSMPKGRVGALFAESIQGVGGAVQYPKNYIKSAFEKIRARGGVCISDEVQTGFARLGTHFWGFETHDVIPDIVTMAKGMGNGFPLAAVVTTPEIASCMGQALHFNTFGGNPISCAVGSAVLDVIEDEKIQEKADVNGTYFIKELMKLQKEFDCVGDVRGKGFMIGVELVKDMTSHEPMSAEDIGQIWEDIKDMGVLVGKGGVYGNVLRVKPPMCITRDDIDFSMAVIRKALENHNKKKN